MSEDTEPRGTTKHARRPNGKGKKGAKRAAAAGLWDQKNRPQWCKLNDKGRRFVDEYCQDLSIARAAEAAGYTYNSARALYCTDLRAAINETLALRSKEAGIAAVDILRDLRIVADKAMGRIPISRTVRDRDGRTLTHHEEFTWDPAAANTALVSLGRHQKLFTDVIEQGSHEDAVLKLHEESDKLGYRVKRIGGVLVMLEPASKKYDGD